MRQLSDRVQDQRVPAVLVHHPGWSDNGQSAAAINSGANADGEFWS